MEDLQLSTYSKTTINRMIRNELTPVFMKLQADYNTMCGELRANRVSLAQLEQIEQFTHMKIEYQEEIALLKEELDIAHHEYDKIKEEKLKLKDLNETLTDRIHELNYDVKNLKNQLSLKSDNYVEIFNEQTHKLQEELIQTKDENINLKKELEQFKNKINSMKEGFRKLLD